MKPKHGVWVRLNCTLRGGLAMLTESINISSQICDGLETILNPDKWNKAKYKVFKIAFEEVFLAQDEGKLQWKRSFGYGDWKVVADVNIKNGHGNNITVPVVFFTWYNDEAGIKGCRIGELKFGEELGVPFLTTSDSRVRRLYAQITGNAWSGDLLIN